MKPTDRIKEILQYIIDEQLDHKEHGDQEYIRICSEAIDLLNKVRNK